MKKTKAEIRAEAAARGEEARYSGKKKKWFFHPFGVNLDTFGVRKVYGNF